MSSVSPLFSTSAKAQKLAHGSVQNNLAYMSHMGTQKGTINPTVREAMCISTLCLFGTVSCNHTVY